MKNDVVVSGIHEEEPMPTQGTSTTRNGDWNLRPLDRYSVAVGVLFGWLACGALVGLWLIVALPYPIIPGAVASYQEVIGIALAAGCFGAGLGLRVAVMQETRDGPRLRAKATTPQ